MVEAMREVPSINPKTSIPRNNYNQALGTKAQHDKLWLTAEPKIKAN